MPLAVVTGANRGIGLELCRQLTERDVQVIAAVRLPSPELADLPVEVVEGVDVSSEQGIAALRSAVADRQLDLLINNAGILESTPLDGLDLAAVRRQLEVNAVSPLAVTHVLLPCLARGAKVALITSRMGSIADNGSGGAYGYRMSKAALNAAGKSLAIDLAARGIAVAILHPGWVQTQMTGGTGQLTPSQSAALLIERIDGLGPDTSGTFWHASGEVLPW